MKILNICQSLPIKGLKLENDIHLRIQKEIKRIEPSIDCTFLKSVPYTNFILSKVKPLWKNYYKLVQEQRMDLDGFDVFFYPWFRLPTSNFQVDNALLLPNKLFNLPKVELILGKQLRTFDLVLSQNNIADGVVASWISQKYKIPHIHFMRGELTEKILNSPVLKKIMKEANVLATPSPTIKKALNKRGTEIQLIPHGVDDVFYFDGVKDLGYPKLLTVARLLKLKNIDKVILALSKAKESNLDFTYTIVGEGPERENLEKLVEQLELSEYVTFTGWLEQNNVAQRMKEANIFVMPSYPETLGRVFLEAAAARCICIGHENTGIDSWFQDCISALFCNKSSLNKTLISTMKNIKNKKLQDISLRGSEIASSISWRNIADNYISLFYNCSKIKMNIKQ